MMPRAHAVAMMRIGRNALLAGCAWLVMSAARGDAQAPTVPVELEALVAGRPEEGLLVLHSGYDNAELIDADAVVFVGADADGTSADVLTVNVDLRAPHGWGRLRVGRFILATGAVRPTSIDGASALARAPWGTTLEVFGGMPVVPRFEARDFDWLAGTRLGQHLLQERIALGVSYLQRRDHGALDDEEIGADLTLLPLAWLSVNAIGSWDLVYAGLVEARLTATANTEVVQVELFGSRRVAARMLPATSLFSVVSDAPGSEIGAGARWRAFPRLRLGGTVALEQLQATYGYRADLQATLRLEDEGQDLGELSAEAMRHELGEQGYTGGALVSRFPLVRNLRGSASLELVAPDRPAGRGVLWPWARAGVTWIISPAWSVAAAIGAKASPEFTHEVQGLARVSYVEQLQP